MTSRGVVRVWHDDAGWGVIDWPETPGGCWTHYVMVKTKGFKTLRVGQDVDFTFEPADQDGYAFRATAVWSTGQEPVDTDERDSGSMRSTLTISFDDEPDHRSQR